MAFSKTEPPRCNAPGEPRAGRDGPRLGIAGLRGRERPPGIFGGGCVAPDARVKGPPADRSAAARQTATGQNEGQAKGPAAVQLCSTSLSMVIVTRRWKTMQRELLPQFSGARVARRRVGHFGRLAQPDASGENQGTRQSVERRSTLSMSKPQDTEGSIGGRNAVGASATSSRRASLSCQRGGCPVAERARCCAWDISYIWIAASAFRWGRSPIATFRWPMRR